MNSVASVVKVGIADMKYATPPQTLRTSGLGSCVGVVLFDDKTKVAGMAHIMLPDSGMSKEVPKNVAKYADTAIPELYKVIKQKGAHTFALKAKIAGGAQMFPFSTSNEMMRIGPRNVEAVKEALKQYRIPIVAEDCGGNSGRTIEFHLDTAVLHIRTVNKGVSEI